MKRLLLLALLFVGAGVSAQNLQFHYDFGRNLYDDLDKTADSDGRAPITTTVEMFRADSFGSTFFFIDLDYNSGVKGAYWEISRELCFWKNSKMNWLSAHLEYDGGLSKAAGSYNNAWPQQGEQLPDNGRVGHRLRQGLVHLLGILRRMARVASVAEHLAHIPLGAAVLGEPEEYKGLGQCPSQRRRRG